MIQIYIITLEYKSDTVADYPSILWEEINFWKPNLTLLTLLQATGMKKYFAIMLKPTQGLNVCQILTSWSFRNMADKHLFFHVINFHEVFHFNRYTFCKPKKEHTNIASLPATTNHLNEWYLLLEVMFDFLSAWINIFICKQHKSCTTL